MKKVLLSYRLEIMIFLALAGAFGLFHLSTTKRCLTRNFEITSACCNGKVCCCTVLTNLGCCNIRPDTDELFALVGKNPVPKDGTDFSAGSTHGFFPFQRQNFWSFEESATKPTPDKIPLYLVQLTLLC